MVTIVRLIVCVAIYLMGTLVNGQNFNKEVDAQIVVGGPKEAMFLLSGYAENKTNTSYSLSFKFSSITKVNDSSILKETKENRFTLQPFETKKIDEFLIEENDSVQSIALLLLYNEGELISTKRVLVNPKEEEQSKQSYNKMNEGIKLRGFVNDNTKTKAGRDFYNFFYQNYNMSPIQSDKIVKIEEIVSFGRTTRLTVKVGDDLVYQFFAQPKLDFLKEQAKNALMRVNQYIYQQKQRNEYQVKY